jgi:hypothetical protein
MLALQAPNFIMTGMGEESYFRGTVYEEPSHRLGTWPAMRSSELATKFGLSMLQGMWFEYVYERKGLRAAVATRALVDIMAFLRDWLLQGGSPNSSGFSINSRELSISFGFRL